MALDTCYEYPMHGPRPILVVGAGIGGLAAAIRLAVNGLAVTLLDSAPAPGGRMREIAVDGRPIDSGPTVLTLRPVFEELFALAGERLADHVGLVPATILARHHWPDGSRLDLHADPAASEAAIEAFAGPREALAFRAFAREAARLFEALEGPFLGAGRPSAAGLSLALFRRNPADLLRLRPYTSLIAALGRHFADPRLVQLFGRYATYAGSDPYRAPATLMLIAHVEAIGVWLVEGGMHAIARALLGLLERLGATVRLGEAVRTIDVEGGEARSVTLASGEILPADAIVFAGDSAALGAGLLGPAAARACRPLPPALRSLSAVTWSVVAEPEGFPLVRHNILFSQDYAGEFAALRAGRLPDDPTIYICAQDRPARDSVAPGGPERLLLIANAPADPLLSQSEIDRCETRSFERLLRAGLELRNPQMVRTTPADFDRLFPGSGGAIYGRATHGPFASFQRPGARSGIPGLYLAGGSSHPGAGVPMVALSGKLAAQAILKDRASTRRFHPAAMPGGISTPSPPTAATALRSSPSSAASSRPGTTGRAGETRKTMSPSTSRSTPATPAGR